MMLRTACPRTQFVVNVVFALFIGALATLFLLGLSACVAQAQPPGAPEPGVSLAQLAGDPLAALVGRLGAGAALIYLLIEGAKRWVPGLDDRSERAGLRLYLAALGLGAVFGLLGVVEPMPSRLPFVGEALAGLGAGTLAVALHSGRRAVKRARYEKEAT